MIICRLLQKFGCRVDVVSNGQEAVEILKRKPHDFHLVLMDLEMPVLSTYPHIHTQSHSLFKFNEKFEDFFNPSK
jgi:CheY-like chemotaxis protein